MSQHMDFSESDHRGSDYSSGYDGPPLDISYSTSNRSEGQKLIDHKTPSKRQRLLLAIASLMVLILAFYFTIAGAISIGPMPNGGPIVALLPWGFGLFLSAVLIINIMFNRRHSFS